MAKHVLSRAVLDRMWEEIEAALEENEGVFIRFTFADLNGIPRGFTVPARNAKSLFFDGLSLASSKQLTT